MATVSQYEDKPFSVKIDGKVLEENLSRNLLEIHVDTSLYMPDMFTLFVYDEDVAFVDEPSLDIGKSVEILVGDKNLFKGEITAIEPDFGDNARSNLLIRGYDQSHRLHRGRKTRTFTKQKDSDVVQKIAKEAGLKADVDATSITHDYLIQTNQTNMEFLLMRAELLGYQVYAAEGTLYFKKGDSNQGDAPELAWLTNLRSFQPRLTATHQAEKTVVTGWDPNTKKLIKSEVKVNSKLNPGGVKKTGGDTAKSAFKASAEAVVVDHPVFTVDEAKGIATSISNELSRAFIEAEGFSYGDPALKPGHNVKIDGVGERFSGTYFITSAIHSYRSGVYRTYFTVSGTRPNTIYHLMGDSDTNTQHWGKNDGRG